MGTIGYVSRSSGLHDERWMRTLRDAGHHVIPFGLQQAQTLAGLAAKHNVDLLVAGPLSDAMVAAVRADASPVLGISWAFDLLLEAGDSLVQAALRETLPRVTGLHVDSRTLARAAQRFGVPEDRISIGAWGIDTDYFTPGPATPYPPETGWSAADRLVFTSRHWEPLYDLPTVLRGFAIASERDPSLRFLLGGGGSQEREIRSMVSDLGMDAVVHMPGRMPPNEVREWLRRSDVYVSGAHSDGTSLTLVEALAVGVPCVVTELETNREWIVSDEVGRLFPVGDAEALAEALLKQLAAPADANVVMAARRLVLARGDWKNNRQIFLSAVDRAIGQVR